MSGMASSMSRLTEEKAIGISYHKGRAARFSNAVLPGQKPG